MRHISAIVISALLAASPALADKPEWAGKGKGHDKSEWRGKGKGHEGRDHRGERGGRHFGEEQRVVVYEYYGESFRSGRCPPGLAKKNNGCMPPGQAKKLYNRGQRFPLNYGNMWNFDQVPNDLRRQYGFGPDANYYYGDGYIYQVDPKTMLIQQVVSAILR